MTNTPLVSIITACYNAQETIARTIEAVLHQTYENIEYLIIDGASTDKTVEIIKGYDAKFGGRLRWLSEKDEGMYHAMNKGIALAKGELIGITNSDDWYENDAVEIAVAQYVRNVKSVVYGILRVVHNGEQLALEQIHHSHLGKEMISHPTCFVPKELYVRYGAFDLRYKSAADYELMLRLFRNSVPFVPVEKVLANFSLGGLTSRNKDRGVVEHYRIRRQHGYLSSVRLYWELFKVRLKSVTRMAGIDV